MYITMESLGFISSSCHLFKRQAATGKPLRLLGSKGAGVEPAERERSAHFCARRGGHDRTR